MSRFSAVDKRYSNSAANVGLQDRNVLASKLKLGKLILRKVIKTVATRCHLKVKMHQIRFGLGLRPRPRWESL